MTKGEHRDAVVVLAAQYAPLLKIPSQIIDQFNEYAVRRVWRTLLTAQEAFERKTVTVNHGDPLPADWVAYGNRAYYTLNAQKVPVRYIPPDLVPTRKFTEYNTATPNYPDFYTVNQKCMFLPDTTMTDPTTGLPYAANLQSVTLHYYPRPPKLFGATIADSTDDGLPAFSAPYVHAASLKRIIEYLVTGPKRQQLMEKARQESIQSIGRLFTDLQKIQKKEVREVV
ncbi:hypothetical protein KGP36_01625 [Patescibacteria group bacterium]|nr:hypothetical protein [Patescibacteria group bacterium]